MKKVISTIFCALTSVLLLIISLVLAFIYARLLFSGELATYARPGYAVFSNIIKLFIALFGITCAVLPWIAKKWDQNSTLRMITLMFLFTLILVSLFYAILIPTGSSTLALSLAEIVIFYAMPAIHAAAVLFFFSKK